MTEWTEKEKKFAGKIEEQAVEIERLRDEVHQLNVMRLDYRQDVIEECALVIKQWENDDEPRSYLDLIEAIRALKEK